MKRQGSKLADHEQAIKHNLKSAKEADPTKVATVSDQVPTVSNQVPKVSDQVATVSEQQPTVSDQAITISDQELPASNPLYLEADKVSSQCLEYTLAYVAFSLYPLTDMKDQKQRTKLSTVLENWSVARSDDSFFNNEFDEMQKALEESAEGMEQEDTQADKNQIEEAARPKKKRKLPATCAVGHKHVGEHDLPSGAQPAVNDDID